MRRPGIGVARRSGFRGIGAGAPASAAPWTPASLDNVITWPDPADAGNTVTGGVFDVYADLGPAGNDFTASGTARPTQETSDLLNGRNVLTGDGVSQYMSVPSTLTPKTIAILVRRNAWVANEAIVTYAAGNRPQLRNGAVSNRYDGLVAGAPVSTTAAVTDGYFRLLILEDTGTHQAITLYDGGLANPVTVTTENANARTVDGGVLALLAFAAGTFPTEAQVAWGPLALSDVLTSDEKASLVEYLRTTVMETGAASVMPFVGTLTTNSDAQPRPYPAEHEGVSGNTLAECALRLVGNWGGSGGTTIGSADDPGAGNRGSMETLATTRGETDLIALVMVGTNDASSGAISATNYERFIRRLFAVAGVTPASNLRVRCAKITPRTDGSGTPQGRIDTFNDTDLPALIATLQGEGFAVDVWDPEADFDTGTMLLADGLHPNILGAQHVAQAAWDALDAGGLISASNSLVLIGDSITAGGATLVPQATAQYRPHLARLLA